MPYKDPAAQKEAQRLWYLRKKLMSPAEYMETRRKRSLEFRSKRKKPNLRKMAKDIAVARENHVAESVSNARNGGCRSCGEMDHSCLDFHHVDPKSKSFSISRRILKINAERIDEEIAKCVVLCKNCHSKFHAGRDIRWQIR